MRCLTLIIHTDDEQALTQLLRESELTNGFTLSHVDGHGLRKEQDDFLAARDLVVGCSPRLRVDLLLEDDDAIALLRTLAELKQTGELADLFYWLNSVDEYGHL